MSPKGKVNEIKLKITTFFDWTLNIQHHPILANAKGDADFIKFPVSIYTLYVYIAGMFDASAVESLRIASSFSKKL